MARPTAFHPDFPLGATVRVKPLGRVAAPNRLRLVGQVGWVVSSNKSVVCVEFPGEKFREHFRPENLDREPDPPAEGRR